jgi:GNAT superfamily N-acetyltransferase
MVDIVVRRAEQRDLQELGKLGAQLVRVHHAFDPQRFIAPEPGTERGYAWFLGTELESEDSVVFVAERGVPGRTEIVGYVYAGVEPRSWKELREEAGFIHDVVVTDQARDGGVGTRLVEVAAEWLKARGVPRVMLWTAERNAGAQRLFERLGFRRTMIEMTREV